MTSHTDTPMYVDAGDLAVDGTADGPPVVLDAVDRLSCRDEL